MVNNQMVNYFPAPFAELFTDLSDILGPPTGYISILVGKAEAMVRSMPFFGII